MIKSIINVSSAKKNGNYVMFKDGSWFAINKTSGNLFMKEYKNLEGAFNYFHFYGVF